MSDRSVVIIGLPASGKTTFLAALWHLIMMRDVQTALRFGDLRAGDAKYLNAIAARWREARVQDRTAVAGKQLVGMNLLDSNEQPLRVSFPDLPGEEYLHMWEDRTCNGEVAEIIRRGDVLLFVHADTIRAPQWVVDEVALSRSLGLAVPNGETVPWRPRLAPTQVQLVDLLQLLRRQPLDVGPRRLGLMLSAWDKARGEGLSPEDFLRSKLPLLAQYLDRSADSWTWRVYGVSAQGGDYDPTEVGKDPTSDAERLRNLDRPSTRIQLVSSGAESHDLTEPLAWLMG
jgi:hypothetical protein